MHLEQLQLQLVLLLLQEKQLLLLPSELAGIVRLKGLVENGLRVFALSSDGRVIGRLLLLELRLTTHEVVLLRVIQLLEGVLGHVRIQAVVLLEAVGSSELAAGQERIRISLVPKVGIILSHLIRRDVTHPLSLIEILFN